MAHHSKKTIMTTVSPATPTDGDAANGAADQRSTFELMMKLNNEGAQLLDSPDSSAAFCSSGFRGKNGRLAMRLFNDALVVPDVFEKLFTAAASSSGAAAAAALEGESHLSYRYDITVTASSSYDVEDDTVFYFFDHAIHLHWIPTRNSPHEQDILSSDYHASRLSMAVLLMNTALACYRVGAAVANSNTNKKAALFQKSVDIYSQLVRFVTETSSIMQQHPRPPHQPPEERNHHQVFSFLVLAALNNASWIYLQLGLTDRCDQVLSGMASLMQKIGIDFFSCEQDRCTVGQFCVNNTLLEMTGNLSGLAACAA